MWLRTNTANQMFKRNVQTQNADGMEVFFSVLYMTQLEAISQQYYHSWEGSSEASAYQLSAESQALDMQHFKTQIDGYLLLLAPCEVSSITSHFTCYYVYTKLILFI